MENLEKFYFSFITPILLILALLISSCEKEVASNSFSVSGKVVIEGNPQSGVNVDIDNLVQYKTITDKNGLFEIKKVAKGNHIINFNKNLENNTFIKKEYEIEVHENLTLSNLVLPKPVSIEKIQLDSVTNEITIIWNKSDAVDFREYKLYSHDSSGLDETTGTLAHVSTSISDTSATMLIEPGTETFFRVFVMNDYAMLGGSNIASITGVNINLISSGDFESIDLFNSEWSVITENGNITIVDTFSYSGNSSLHFNTTFENDSTSMHFSVIEHQIILDENTQYEFNFFYKAAGLTADWYPLRIQCEQENNIIFERDYADEWPGYGSFGQWGEVYMLYLMDWQFYSKFFFPNNNSPIIFRFIVSTEHVFIDNLSLRKKL